MQWYNKVNNMKNIWLHTVHTPVFPSAYKYIILYIYIYLQVWDIFNALLDHILCISKWSLLILLHSLSFFLYMWLLVYCCIAGDWYQILTLFKYPFPESGNRSSTCTLCIRIVVSCNISAIQLERHHIICEPDYELQCIVVSKPTPNDNCLADRRRRVGIKQLVYHW